VINFVIALYTRDELLIMRYKLRRYGITNTAGYACCDTSIALFLHNKNRRINMALDFLFLSI